MANRKPPDTPATRERFPYEVLWEELGDQRVTISYLEGNAHEFRFFNEQSDLIGLNLPNPKPEQFADLVAASGLKPIASSSLAAEFWLIAGWYLAPERKKGIRNDLRRAREILTGIVQAARNFYELTGKVSPSVAALLEIVREDEPEVFDSTGLSINDLGRSMHDVALAAERILADVAPQGSGRPRNYVRDTTMTLAIEAVERAGLNDLTISAGTQAQPDPHLSGKAGEFLRGFFALIEPNKNEASLAAEIKRVRRKMRS